MRKGFMKMTLPEVTDRLMKGYSRRGRLSSGLTRIRKTDGNSAVFRAMFAGKTAHVLSYGA